jgi:hypothetical protein
VPIFVYSPMGNMFSPPAPPFDLRLDLWLSFWQRLQSFIQRVSLCHRRDPGEACR